MAGNQTSGCDCAPFPRDTFQQVNTDYRSAVHEGFVEAQGGLGFLIGHLPIEAEANENKKQQPGEPHLTIPLQHTSDRELGQ